MRNWKRNAVQNSIGVAKRILPPHIVPSQLKILMPVGTAMSIVEKTKKVLAPLAHADGEHVVRPHAEADEADRRPSPRP